LKLRGAEAFNVGFVFKVACELLALNQSGLSEIETSVRAVS